MNFEATWKIIDSCPSTHVFINEDIEILSLFTEVSTDNVQNDLTALEKAALNFFMNFNKDF